MHTRTRLLLTHTPPRPFPLLCLQWCGHCKQLAPEYIKAAADLAKDGLAIAKVDATQEVDLKAVAEVKSYPTLIFFCEGRTFPFEGERNADSLAAFVRANTFTDAEVLDSAADVKQFVSDSDVAVVGVFDNLDGPEAVAFLRGTSCLQRDYAIAITTDAGAATELGASAPAVLVFKSYHGGSRDEYEGEMEPKGISAFVTDKVTMFPEEDHVLVLTDDTFDLALEEYGTLLAEFYAPVRGTIARVCVCMVTLNLTCLCRCRAVVRTLQEAGACLRSSCHGPQRHRQAHSTGQD